MALRNALENVATETKQDTQITRLTEIRDYVDTVEALIQALLTELGQKVEVADLGTLATSAKQDVLIGHVDDVEGLLTSIRDNADTVEAKLQLLVDQTDGLEGFTDGIESLLTTIRDNTDGLELSLTDIDLNTDEIESALLGLFTELAEKLEAGDITGLATSANQSTEITRLTEILTAFNSEDFATDTVLQDVRDRLPTALDGGALSVSDTYTQDEALAMQTGVGGILTFNFTVARDLIWVRSEGATSWAKVTGTPGDKDGIFCEDGIPQPITVRASVIKVYAPTGAEIYVWGYSG